MTVYVDDSAIPAAADPHMSQWSHLFADSQDERRDFAARLGLRRSWSQPGRSRRDGTPSPFCHYDITTGKRQHAIRLGAWLVACREMAEIIRPRETWTAVQRLGAEPAPDLTAAATSLREQTAARLAAAGIGADDPGLIAVVRHNAELGISTVSVAGTEREPSAAAPPGCPPASARQAGQASASSSSGQRIAPSSPPARRRGLSHREGERRHETS